MKIIGYGICGPGEAGRYMRATLDEFKRLCDAVVILCNNTTREENDLIDSYGFDRVSDKREWGRWQWKIKQDFINRNVKAIAKPGDMIVCLDMDEVFDKTLTKEWLLSAPFDAYHVYVVDLWNSPESYKPESCFWNVRLWRWNGETNFKAKPVHCGLAPEWTYHYHRHAPFFLKHYGLMAPEDRERKIARYQKYDPHAEHMDRRYYDMLKSNTSKPFDEQKLRDELQKEVRSYNQTKPKTQMTNQKPKERFCYVKNPHGEIIDIPERHLQMTLKRGGFEFISYADEDDKTVEEMFDDSDQEFNNDEPGIAEPTGSYQRSTADEMAEFNARNAATDKALADSDIDSMMEEGEEHAEAAPKPKAKKSPKKKK